MARNLAVLGSLALVLALALAWSVNRGEHSGSAAGKRSGVTGGALTWHVLRSYTARRIQNEYLPTTAHGVYLVLDLAATNGANGAVQLDRDHVLLQLNGKRYPADGDGASALELSGHGLLAAANLAPAATATGWIVFDVPPQAVTAAPVLCLAQQTAREPACGAALPGA